MSFVAMQPDCGVWKRNHPLHGEHAATHAPTHRQELWESAQTGRSNPPGVKIPNVAFSQKPGSGWRPRYRYQLADPDFPPRVCVSSRFDCAEMMPSERTLCNHNKKKRVYKIVPPSRVPSARSRRYG